MTENRRAGSKCPAVPQTECGTAGHPLADNGTQGNTAGRQSLKSLAMKVLSESLNPGHQWDTVGTGASQIDEKKGETWPAQDTNSREASVDRSEAPDTSVAVRDKAIMRLVQTDADGQQAERESVKVPDLENRLIHHGIRIAVDRATGSALLVFTDAEHNATQGVADLHRPFEVRLTSGQRRELLESLDYYESLINRKTLQSGEKR